MFFHLTSNTKSTCLLDKGQNAKTPPNSSREAESTFVHIKNKKCCHLVVLLFVWSYSCCSVLSRLLLSMPAAAHPFGRRRHEFRNAKRPKITGRGIPHLVSNFQKNDFKRRMRLDQTQETDMSMRCFSKVSEFPRPWNQSKNVNNYFFRCTPDWRKDKTTQQSHIKRLEMTQIEPNSLFLLGDK